MGNSGESRAGLIRREIQGVEKKPTVPRRSAHLGHRSHSESLVNITTTDT